MASDLPTPTQDEYARSSVDSADNNTGVILPWSVSCPELANCSYFNENDYLDNFVTHKAMSMNPLSIHYQSATVNTAGWPKPWTPAEAANPARKSKNADSIIEEVSSSSAPRTSAGAGVDEEKLTSSLLVKPLAVDTAGHETQPFSVPVLHKWTSYIPCYGSSTNTSSTVSWTPASYSGAKSASNKNFNSPIVVPSFPFTDRADGSTSTAVGQVVCFDQQASVPDSAKTWSPQNTLRGENAISEPCPKDGVKSDCASTPTTQSTALELGDCIKTNENTRNEDTGKTIIVDNSGSSRSVFTNSKEETSETEDEPEQLCATVVSSSMEKKAGIKPAISYIELIARAILSTPEQKMMLQDIYRHIMTQHPYYNNDQKAWRNSVRHNLSLNECFIKHMRTTNGKGHFWNIHPNCVADFLKGDFRRRHARQQAKSRPLCHPAPSPKHFTPYPAIFPGNQVASYSCYPATYDSNLPHGMGWSMRRNVTAEVPYLYNVDTYESHRATVENMHASGHRQTNFPMRNGAVFNACYPNVNSADFLPSSENFYSNVQQQGRR